MSDIITEKYRPKCLDDCILPKRIRRPLEKLIKRGKLGHLIFYGRPGNGKTSTVGALIKELKSENSLTINASLNNSVDYITQSLPKWATGLFGGRRIIFFDEADNLTDKAQKVLKVPLEEYAEYYDMVFCLNDFNNVIDAIKSRCHNFCFDIMEEEKEEVKDLIIKRLLYVSKKEKIRLKKKDIERIYSDGNGDIRAMLKELELF